MSIKMKAADLRLPKHTRVSRSGRTFTQRGVKQQIVKGSLLRSIGYGSRIVQVLGFVMIGRYDGYKEEWVIARHFCNTSHFVVPNPHGKPGRDYYTVDIKGNRQRSAQCKYSAPFLTSIYGWQVVREVAKDGVVRV
jgi:hypothetical protein